MQQQQGHRGNVADESHDINWLEYWPESEFRLDQTPTAAAGGADPHLQSLLAPGSMLPQAHNGDVIQHPGTLQEHYGSAAGVAAASADRSQFQVCVSFTSALQRYTPCCWA